MKDRTLALLSLCLSIVAIGYAAWVHSQPDRLAAAALAKREREIVSHFAPRLSSFYHGLTGKADGFPTDPKTFEELFDPLVAAMDQLGSEHKTADGETK